MAQMTGFSDILAAISTHQSETARIPKSTDMLDVPNFGSASSRILPESGLEGIRLVAIYGHSGGFDHWKGNCNDE